MPVPSKRWLFSNVKPDSKPVRIEDELAVGREKLERPEDCPDCAWNAVGRQHCLLRPTEDGRLFVRSHTQNKLHFCLEGANGWRVMAANDRESPLERTFERAPFSLALLDPKGDGRHLIYNVTPDGPGPAVRSFDEQYLELVRRIIEEGAVQNNKKGDNKALSKPFELVLDLDATRTRAADSEMALPLTSLRSLNAKHAVTEALWYLRGEDHIKFLLQHDCGFWTKPVNDGPRPADKWLGLNYGLLVNWPSADGRVNQLEEKVLSRLVNGDCSRQMFCSLVNPNEKTEQEACTSLVQFLVRANNPAVLDLCIHQRSSDVIIGLVHDVVVWSIILHLVCREVRLRTEGERGLRAGRVEFRLTHAHVYTNHIDGAKVITAREPKAKNTPTLHVAEEAEGLGMFEIANNFERGPKLLSVKGQVSHPKIKFEVSQ